MDTQPRTGVNEASPFGIDARLVRTSGFCVWCDSRFTDELVWRVPHTAVPGGVVYVERRHVESAGS